MLSVTIRLCTSSISVASLPGGVRPPAAATGAARTARANTVRGSAAQRRPTPAASYDARYVARAQVASKNLTGLTTPNEAGRADIDKTLNVYGTSLDEFFTTRLATAGLRVDDAAENQQILDSLTNKQGWSADGLRNDLQALAACAAPGQQADIVTVAEAGERLLAGLGPCAMPSTPRART